MHIADAIQSELDMAIPNTVVSIHYVQPEELSSMPGSQVGMHAMPIVDQMTRDMTATIDNNVDLVPNLSLDLDCQKPSFVQLSIVVDKIMPNLDQHIVDDTMLQVDMPISETPATFICDIQSDPTSLASPSQMTMPIMDTVVDACEQKASNLPLSATPTALT